MTSGPPYNYIPPRDKEARLKLLTANTYHKSTLYIGELNIITDANEKALKIQLWQDYTSMTVDFRHVNSATLNTFFTSLQNNSPTLMTDLYNLVNNNEDVCGVFIDYLSKVLRRNLTEN